MKTAISIDDEVYRAAEHTAAQLGLTRSSLYSLAVAEYIRNHNTDILLQRLNEVYGGGNSTLDEDVQEAQFRLFSGEDW
ncbi:hypothetical protein LQZ21_09070 [Treponema sp. TIM-1]|uniref:hypothetical protein n=1 Tax=Treponema sp. TIM-1 TaxID=2898417 RepID=UPI00397EACC5